MAACIAPYAYAADSEGESERLLQVRIPGAATIDRTIQAANPELLAQYIISLYRFGVWFAISLSIFMIMFGGFQWLVSGGSPDRIGRAKGYISNALIGLILALASYIILETINPQLVNLEIPVVTLADQYSGLTAEWVECCNETTDQQVRKPPESTKSCQEYAEFLGSKITGWTECPDLSNVCCTCTGGSASTGGTDCYKNLLPAVCNNKWADTMRYDSCTSAGAACERLSQCRNIFD